MNYAKEKYNPALIRNRILVFGGILLAVIIAVSVAVLLLKTANERVEHASYPREYKELVEKSAQEFGVDPLLVYSVMKQESGFDPKSLSHADARGLMQITPETLEWLQWKLPDDPKYTEDDLFLPEVNIRYGCKFLSILQTTYEVLGTGIAAYNAGMGSVDGWLSDTEYSTDGKTLASIPYPETKAYVQKVLDNYQNYQALYKPA